MFPGLKNNPEKSRILLVNFIFRSKDNAIYEHKTILKYPRMSVYIYVPGVNDRFLISLGMEVRKVVYRELKAFMSRIGSS